MSSKGDFYYHITALHPEVTGSCINVCVNFPDGERTNFLVDCGMFQERAYTQLNGQKLPFNALNIEFAFITHNHADHNGRMPILMKEGFNGKIYCTDLTKALMYHSLMDDYKIMLNTAKEKKQKPWYEEADVLNVMRNAEGHQVGDTIYVNSRIKATFIDNGHLPGATMILVQISYFDRKDINILFTGDYKETSHWREIADIPDWVKEIPKTVVTESTYGYMDSDKIVNHYEEDVVKILAQRKSLLQLVFAQERAQLILLILKKLQDEGKISKAIPIYLDGNLAQIFTKILQRNSEVEFIPENFTLVNKNNREEVLYGGGQKIILTTSGMADHGPACIYIPVLISRKDYVFYFTGYISPDSLAYKIQNPKDGKITMKGMEYDVNVEVYTTSEYSSHAKADELVKMLKTAGNVNLVLINHGQIDSQYMLKERVMSEVTKHVEVLSSHTAVVGEYGLVKMMGSKLYTVRKPKEESTDKKECNNKHQKPKMVRYVVNRH